MKEEIIKVIFKNNEIKGLLIKENDEFITLKLSNGYNSILNKSNISKIIRKENDEINNNFKFANKELNNTNDNNYIDNIDENNTNNIDKNKRSNSNKNIKNMIKIKILHTGGTIASKVDYSTGAVSSKFTPEELLNLYPELNEKAILNVEMIGNIFSEDFRFAHYNLLLEKIKNAVNENYNGIIITHGTDTLHYTSSALQYAIKNLSIPIILVGAQRSSDRPSSDAFFNLNAGIDFIKYNFKEKLRYMRVGVCMHSTMNDNEFMIFDSINLKKMHSTRRDAFKQINYSPVFRIKYSLNNFDNFSDIELLRKELLSDLNEIHSIKKLDFSYSKYDENLKIGFFKAHPNLFPEEIKLLNIYDGIIIEGTGLGHLGINNIDEKTKIHENNLKELKKLALNKKIIMGVQTISGVTNLDVYSTGRYLNEIGILGNHMNLTTETLFIRLAFVLSNLNKSNNLKDKSIYDINFNKLWNSNLEGF